MQKGFMRVGRLYLPDEILPLVDLEHTKNRIDLDGYSVNIASDRLKCFKVSGIVCKCCGLHATNFTIEKTIKQVNDSYHLNLYYLEDSPEILFTKDHVVPRSSGGEDKISNYQTLCAPCNVGKASKIVRF